MEGGERVGVEAAASKLADGERAAAARWVGQEVLQDQYY